MLAHVHRALPVLISAVQADLSSAWLTPSDEYEPAGGQLGVVGVSVAFAHDKGKDIVRIRLHGPGVRLRAGRLSERDVQLISNAQVTCLAVV